MPENHSLLISSRILIVDDNPSNVMLLEAMLEQEGFRDIHQTTNSLEVVSLDQKYNYDLILLDIQMPRMDGFEVMEALKQYHQDNDYLPVLVLTAQTDLQTRLRALDLGARDFVTKPFQHDEVLQRIYNALEIRYLYKQQRNYNERLEEKVREATNEIRKAQLDVVRCLGRAGEYRDNETGEHVIRMSKFCQILALEAGLSQNEADLIFYASPMHDIGKIAISDQILLKAGKLTAEEWEIMKSHAQLGADILKDNSSEIVKMARIIALSHHEKWDGSGYPNGLSGKNIPYAGRIAAICDVFDALTSARSYKEPWDINSTTQYMKEQSGKHFDPVLLEKFLNILPKVLMIKQHHVDKENHRRSIAI